jgi:hypothetical protein
MADRTTGGLHSRKSKNDKSGLGKRRVSDRIKNMGEQSDIEDKGEGRRGPNPIIIIAVAVVVILVLAIIFMAVFNKAEINQILLGNIKEMDYDGDVYPETLFIPIIVSSDSIIGSLEGKATVTVNMEGNESILYEKTVKINEETESIEIIKSDFVISNGVYDINIKSGDHSDTKTFVVGDVVEKLLVSWKDNRSESASWNDMHEVTMTLSLKDADGGDLLGFAHNGYPPIRFTGTLTDPGGIERGIQFEKLIGTTTTYRKVVDHHTRGTYTMTGTLENMICSPSSPYRSVEIDRDQQEYYVDARPAANAGGDQVADLENGRAEVIFDGSLSWDDGEIVQYIWDFGDGTNATFSTPVASHVYTEAGDYIVELVVVDDSGQRSIPLLESVIVVHIE